MSFTDELRQWAHKVETRSHAVFLGTATEALRSIQEGSEITGALGQPVDTGTLRASWTLTFPTRDTARIATNVAYAPVIEDNLRNATFKNHGAHSVKTTRAGLVRIVEVVTARVVGGG